MAIGTSGPGATNLVTAIADAQMDSTPTLFITGQVKTTLRGTNAFQEADVIGITQPIVKHSIAIERADDVAQAVVDAIRIATTGRPGPVLIDLPVDIANAPAREEVHEPYLPGYRPRARPNGRQIRWAAEALCAAQRPVLYVGGGVVAADAADELRAFAELCGAPVTTTLMALGAFPASDPQWLGMLGMHGTRVANWAMDEADLIIAIGARFDDRVTGAIDEFARGAKIIHIDIDASEIGKIVDVDIPIVGDAKLALAALCRRYAQLPDRPSYAQWWSRIRGWQSAQPSVRPEPEDGCVEPESALDVLSGMLGDAIVTTDVGQHQMWAANRLLFDAPRRWLTSGGLGTMGFGLPAALGAAAACPDTPVVCVSGEGSFLMNVQELATAVEERLPVKVVLLDNASLGMVRQQQDMFWGGRRSSVDLGASPDWELLARAFGWSVRSIGDTEDVTDALAATLNRGRPLAPSPPDRPGGQLPADVPPGRTRPGNDRLSPPARPAPDQRRPRGPPFVPGPRW